jgi:CYTH domain-containing protein
MPLEIERKYLLRTPPPAHRVAAMATLDIEQRYVELTGAVEVRVRRQSGTDGVTYTRTEKQPIGDDPTVRAEHEELVGAAEWDAAAGAPSVRKRRHVFVHDGQRFELDELLHPRQAWVLEVELGSVRERVRLPDWLDVEREVTADPAWHNAAIAAAAPY